jgi:hypothetical protein
MRFDKVSYDLGLSAGERCFYHHALQNTSRPMCFGVSDRALFMTRELFLKMEAYRMERIPFDEVKEVVLSRERGPWTWIKWTIVLAFGLVSSVALAIGLTLTPDYKPGVIGTGGPIAFVVVGLAMLIDSRWRLVLTIRTKKKDWKWRPSIFDKREEVAGLREGILDACRYVRIPTRRLDLANSSEIRRFWRWFESHAKKGRISLDAVTAKLHKLCDRVDAEIRDIGSKQQIIITANYALDAFPVVEELVLAAPKIPDLAITAFRPGQPANRTHSYEGTEYPLDNIYFVPFTDGFDLVIEIYANLEFFNLNVVWDVFKHLLGEYEFVVGVHYAEVRDLSEVTDDLVLRPISELSDLVEDFHHFEMR